MYRQKSCGTIWGQLPLAGVLTLKGFVKRKLFGTLLKAFGASEPLSQHIIQLLGKLLKAFNFKDANLTFNALQIVLQLTCRCHCCCRCCSCC